MSRSSLARWIHSLDLLHVGHLPGDISLTPSHRSNATLYSASTSCSIHLAFHAHDSDYVGLRGDYTDHRDSKLNRKCHGNWDSFIVSRSHVLLTLNPKLKADDPASFDLASMQVSSSISCVWNTPSPETPSP